MVESLDELLQSLETKSQIEKKSTTSKQQLESFPRSELSLDIKDILTLDLEDSPVDSRPKRKSTELEKIKCCPTFIGGTGLIARCHRSPFRICSALHCRNCDSSVISFPDHKWIEQVEYLFLRTNMPEFRRVAGKLKRQNGTAAYACHCVSYSAEKLQPLHELDLPWFCRGHL